MQVVKTVPKREVLFNTELYVLNTNANTIIDQFDINSLEIIKNITINRLPALRPNFITDDNCFYFISQDSNFVIADKMSGEVFNEIKLRSIVASNLVQDDNYVYFISVLPTKIKNIDFSNYFISKINKNSGELNKLAFYTGSPLRKLAIFNNNLIFSDTTKLRCWNDDLIWEATYRSIINKTFVTNDKYIVSCSNNGIVQGFDIKNGENKFNIQLSQSDCNPLLNDNFIWFDKVRMCIIDLTKLCNKEHHWQICQEPISKDITTLFYDNGMICGTKAGQIERNKEIILDLKSPIINMFRMPNYFVIESNSYLNFAKEN